MKQIIKYINIISIPLLFLGCTPITPSVPTKVFENRPIEATIKIDTSTPSLGREISNIPITTIEVPNNTVNVATESAKTPIEPVTPVYQDIIEENSPQIEEIPTEEEEVNITEEVIIDQLPADDIQQSSKAPVEETVSNPYGNPPKDYRASIRNYLSKKANPNDTLKYVFSRPQKAEKKDKSWKGWMVKVDMLKRNGKGKILKNQPYTILFNGSSILEDIANDNPKNVTKVIY